MRRIATAFAALVLVTGAAYAQGGGKGKGGDDKGGSGPAAASAQGGGQGGGRAEQGNRGGGEGSSMATSMRGSEVRGNESRAGGNTTRAERGNANSSAQGNAQRASDRGNRTVAINRRGAQGATGDDRGRDRNFIALGARGLIAGCPPGLAKKNPPCVPPGQARLAARLFAFDRPDWWGLTGLGGGRYVYDDGYLARIGGDGRIGGYIPLLGGALAIGNAWPSSYAPVRLPAYYDDYYDLGPNNAYRYADNVIYRVDPETTAITSIAALLTGDDFTVGRPLPLGYDVYNVPSGYRDRYYDTPDAMYRYSDGYVYQVDPETRLVASAIELLAT